MNPPEITKTIVQCDFDGTITEKDVSFLLLDKFANGNWRKILEDYHEGNISVGDFNTRAFAMIKADKKTPIDFMFKSGKVKIRPGFKELLTYCSKKGLEFVIVSNGLQFYIEAILQEAGINNLEIFAAQNWFKPGGMEAKYIGPDGKELTNDFKEAYINLFLEKGIRVIYIGNGISDIYAAGRAHHVFAIDELLDNCKEENIKYTPFNDLNDVIKGLELLQPG